MPPAVSRTKSASSNPLVMTLATRLAQPLTSLTEPFIIEDEVRQTKSLHVVVIWDKWKSLDRAARSKVILDAYDAAGRTGSRTVTVAMGLTQREALQLGLLRYSIIITHRKGDKVSLRDLQKAYESA